MSSSLDSGPGTNRRTVLRGAVAVGLTTVAGSALSACGGGDDSATQSPDGASSGGSGRTAAAPAPAGTALGPTADVPVGGGKIFSTDYIVVTQPTAGDFKAFWTKCTHEGCPVTQVTGGVIQCPCHGSRYSIEDGSVKGGPAPAPLTAVKITTTGGTITVA